MKSSKNGFTLVELLVAIIILAVLIGTLILTLNPIDQFNKMKDAQRKHDLEQVRGALDAYFNDKGCYPTSVPFGSTWQVGGTVYMKKMPQDPDCYSTGYCYFYQTDTTSNCPQWNALYARLSRSITKMTTDERKQLCPLSDACGVQYLRYTYCILSGTVDCSYISSNPPPPPSIPNTPTPTPTIALTPTPTIPPVDCNNDYYAVDPSSNNCNSLGTDQRNLCSIHGGTYYCWSAPSLPGDPQHCSGFPCAPDR